MIADDLQSPFLQSSKQKRPVESSAGTSNPKSPETFSVFADGSCGEPLEPQHLTIDFTPNEEMDTEFVQKKVCSFWQFIENSPEIHNLRVNADRNIILETDSSSGSHKPGSKMDNSTDFIDHEFLDDNDDDEKTAIEMLQLAEDKNLINRIFGTKMPSTQCSLGPREYVEDTKPTNPKKKEEKKKKKKKKGPGPSTSSPSVPCPQNASHVPNKKPSKANGSELSLLSRQLNDWDANHFKNMDPPGHAPSLHDYDFEKSPAQLCL